MLWQLFLSVRPTQFPAPLGSMKIFPKASFAGVCENIFTIYEKRRWFFCRFEAEKFEKSRKSRRWFEFRMIELLNFRLCLHESFVKRKKKMSCVKNAVKFFSSRSCSTWYLRKAKSVLKICVEVETFSRRHWPIFVKNCEKKCSINNRRRVISGHRQQPKPTFRNSTHSPRSPIAFCRQFSATLRSLNIKSRKTVSPWGCSFQYQKPCKEAAN